MHKLMLSTAAIFTFALAAANARADVPPMPECVNNPACQQPQSCSVSFPTGAPVGVGAAALAAAALLVARRRAAR